MPGEKEENLKPGEIEEMPGEKEENLKPGEIEAIPTDQVYNVVVDDEKVQVASLETALVLSKLDRIDKQLQELQKKK